jgi:hypothetical protein
MLDTSVVGPSFQAVEIDDHMRYCGPCGTQTDSHVLVVRPTSNGVKDGAAYWEAEVWECKVCGHGGQTLRPLRVTSCRTPARLG